MLKALANALAEAKAARAASCLRWQRISSTSLLGVSQRHSRTVALSMLCLQVEFMGPLTRDIRDTDQQIGMICFTKACCWGFAMLDTLCTDSRGLVRLSGHV